MKTDLDPETVAQLQATNNEILAKLNSDPNLPYLAAYLNYEVPGDIWEAIVASKKVRAFYLERGDEQAAESARIRTERLLISWAVDTLLASKVEGGDTFREKMLSGLGVATAGIAGDLILKFALMTVLSEVMAEAQKDPRTFVEFEEEPIP